MNNHKYQITKNPSEQLNIQYNKKIILKRFLTKDERILIRSFWKKYEYKSINSKKNILKETKLNQDWYNFLKMSN